MAYATNADVLKRFPGKALSATTTPSTTTVDAWIAEAEARLNQELFAQSLTVPISDSNGIIILREIVTSKVASRWMAGASSASPDGDKILAGALAAEYDDFLERIHNDMSGVARMLGQAPGTTTGPSAVRSHVLDSSITVEDPVFTKNGRNW